MNFNRLTYCYVISLNWGGGYVVYMYITPLGELDCSWLHTDLWPPISDMSIITSRGVPRVYYRVLVFTCLLVYYQACEEWGEPDVGKEQCASQIWRRSSVPAGELTHFLDAKCYIKFNDAF